ncbi:His Kinase A (phospho-acceptor) domain-containing protein [Flavobacterium resistens]|uniref:histidine kinase n=2 Tax=Flavobacterium resistens TaxID=443612 RepID=A0A521DCG3_9FLAO|nr:response regulator [Flavobacterium resistens]SMO69326.1 His Kinase A (phospho-acceptor) domain-containing protein [Flavobacterium resistens]
MLYYRFCSLFLIFLSIFCHESPAQSNTASMAKINDLTQQACDYLDNANYEKSLEKSGIALKYAFDLKNDTLISRNYNIIAINFHELGEVDKAAFFYKKALFYAKHSNIISMRMMITSNLGNLYFFEKKMYTDGIRYYKESLKFGKDQKYAKEVAITNLNIVWSYFKIGNYSEGLPYLRYINDHQNDLKGKSDDIALNFLNGMYWGHEKDNEKAKKYFLKAISSYDKSSDEITDLLYAHLEYSKFLNNIGEFENAYKNLVIYNSIKDEITNKEKVKKASTAGFNRELDEYKRQIDKIESEKIEQYHSLRKSRIIVILFIVISLILLLLIITLIKNIRLKKKANIELLQAKEIAEEASLLKTQFISTISHELRTPLYGVVGITNMLLEEHKELSRSQHLSSLKFSARYLLSLVNDILQINKIEENKVVLENLTFNISDEITVIKNSLSFLSQKNNNKINVYVDPDIPEYLIGDKLRLAQILMNLVSNALKFTKDGEVEVKVDLSKIEGKNYFLDFLIKDNGVGIATVDQGKVFEKFVQVGRKEEDYQGTGLGLSIVKRLLGLFGSNITLESDIGQGTSFSFVIPFEHDPQKTKKIIEDIEVDLTSNDVFKILVVEDNLINQMVTKKIIEKNNYTCKVVDDGFAALEILEKEDFDLILMDINMPLMNGFETTKRIRLKGIKTPIVALTAFDKDEITDEALSSGMNDIIIKPFEPVKLFKIVNYLIHETINAG